MGEVTQATRATVKGHNLTVGTRVMFHGMASDNFPAIEGTLCVLGKEGNKYTITTVDPKDSDPTGKPWVWTFGAAAALWASPVECICDDIIAAGVDALPAEGAKCPCGGSFARPGTEAAGTPVTADGFCLDGECGTCADCVKCAGVVESTLSVFAEAMAEAELDEAAGVCQMCQQQPRTHEIHTSGSFIGSMSTPSRPVFHVCAGCRDMIMATAELSGSGRPNVVALWVEDPPNGIYPYRVTWQEPACQIYLALTLEDAEIIRRRVSPDRHRDVNAYLVKPTAEPVEVPGTGEFADPTNTPAIPGYYWKRYVLPGDSVTACSTYQLVQDGTTCQVAAKVKYVKDGLWQATGCVWMSTALTPGTYWDGEAQVDAFAHVVQYMTWVASVRGSGLTWAEINKLDWRTPYVHTPALVPAAGDTVYRESDGAQGVIRDVLVSGELDIAADGGAGMVRTAAELAAEGYEIISAVEVERAAVELDLNHGITGYSKGGLPIFRNRVEPGRSLVTGRMVGVPEVKPMSVATADVLMPVRAPKISTPIMTRLNKRTRKAGKRHAFAGKR